MIESLAVRGFRSLSNVEVRFGNPSVVVGRNGSGKSSLLDALQFLADCASMPLSAALDLRGGIRTVRHRTPGTGKPRNLAISATVRTRKGVRFRYALEVVPSKGSNFQIKREECMRISMPDKVYFSRSDGEVKSSVDGFTPKLDGSALALPLFGSFRDFRSLVKDLSSMRVYSIGPVVLRDFQEPDDGLSLKADARNAASVLKEIYRRSPDDVERMGQLLSACIPNTRLMPPQSYGHRLGLEFGQTWDGQSITFPSLSMSDGTLRMTAIILAAFQNSRPALMALDEPETSLHPGSLAAAAEVLMSAGQHSQVVITTQSPELLETPFVERATVLVAQWRDGQTSVKEMPSSMTSGVAGSLFTLGELLRARQLEEADVLDRPAQIWQ